MWGGNGERLPPHDEGAEAGVLGCVLLAPEESLSTCEERGVAEDWFYLQQHRVLWRAIARVRQIGGAVDVLTVWSAAQAVAPDLEAEQGQALFAYLAGLPERVPQAGHLPHYLELLRGKWTRRRLLENAVRATAAAFDEQVPVDEAVAEQQRAALAISEENNGRGEKDMRTLLREVVDEAENYHRGGAQITGLVTTGITYLDKLLCGLGGQNGNFVVLAARPGIGKTSLALDIARHVALRHVWFEKVLDANGQPLMDTVGEGESAREQYRVTSRKGYPVGIFSLEMRDRRLIRRMLFQHTQADMQRFRNGFATNADMTKLARGVMELGPAKIWVDDAGRTSIERIKAKARRWHRQYGVRLFVLDYLQLVQPARRTGRPDRVQEIMDICGELQALGKEMDACWLVLAQLNRDFEKEPHRMPRMSDLKDCGAIEQDADVIMFLYQPLLKDEQAEFTESVLTRHFGADWSSQPKRVNALVAKNRDGEDGVAELLFIKRSTHFVDWNEWLKEKGEKREALGDRLKRKRTVEDYEEEQE